MLRSRDSKFTRSPISWGRLPENEFAWTETSLSSLRRPTVGGKLPEKLLLSSTSTWSNLRFERPEGSNPENLLPLRSRDSNFSKLHMLLQGIGPVKAQRLRLRYLSSLNCPMVLGNGRFRGSSVHDRSIPRTTASSHLSFDFQLCK